MTLARRRRMLVGLILFALGAAVGGLVAARFVRSPQQAVADLEPPPAAVLVEPVTKRQISQTLILRGTASAEGSVNLALAAMAAEDASTVVTAVPVKEGQQVKPGTVLLEVSGRPVILLPGALPQYRDLNPGDRGDDVEQLQEGLASLGYDVEASGRFDAATSRAVNALYTDRGYDARAVGDPKELRTAERAVGEAETAVDDARARLRAAPDEPGKQAAQRELDKAETALEDAVTDRDDLRATTGYALPRAETVFVPGTVRVDKLGVSVGYDVSQSPAEPGENADPSQASGTVALSWGAVTAQAEIRPDQIPLLQKGTRVEVLDEMSGWQGKGVVTNVPKDATASPVVTIGPAEGTFPLTLAGPSLRVTFTDAQTKGEVLAVPVAALVTDASGAPAVERMRDGQRTHVPVTLGAKGDGYLEVTPANRGDLTTADQVVVGLAQAAPQPRPS